jgi:hypothetical protein
MKKFLFLSALVCAQINFGSGAVREQFNADQSEREKLISDGKPSIVVRFIELLRKK